jgi:predicted ATPase/DNA-binding CsgD family transcriptional regulator
LLTFTGPGGVGKTRLALELAYRARSDFRDGVWLAKLADLGVDAGVADVESAMITALGVTDQSASPPGEKLLSFLHTRKLLLVVDNCEHVAPSVRAVLPVILREAPHLRVITTSREPLGIPGEVLRPVLPLTVPDPATPAAQLAADGSVSLLADRAQAVDPDFAITDDNAEAVVELCRLLDGFPLAIELAAVKLRALTVEQVVERFGRRLTALSSPAAPPASRHRSLRAMVDWSHELCSPTAQVLWRRLSVFPATFDLELAEAVCAFGDLGCAEVVDTIERLVGQSILLTDRSGGAMRYHLPAPLREVATELAGQASETPQLERRHRDAMLQRAEEILERWGGPGEESLIARLRRDHASYLAALHWSATTPGEEQAGLALLGRLRYGWLSGGLLAEGRMRTEALLETATEPTPARAECVWVVAWIALLQGDHGTAGRWLAELAALADELQEPRLGAHLHHWRALLALFTGDAATAVPGFEAAVEGHHAHGDRYLELTARYMLATALVCADRAAEALPVSATTSELCEQCGNRSARAYAHWSAALAHWRLGQLDQAERSARTALQLQRTLSDGICVALITDLLAWVSHDRGQTMRTAALSVAAGRVWRSLGTSLQAFGPQLAGFAEQHAAPRPEGEPAEAVPAVRVRDLDDVIDLGLDLDRGPTKDGRAASTEPLTRREVEVAALIEGGLSNREIAQRLIIAKRTADGHVERILAKLGFTSRAQIAAWMARRTNSAAR